MAVRGGPKLELITVGLLCVLGVIASAEVFRPRTTGPATPGPAAEQAISVLTELLDHEPGAPMDLGARWLLNIAYMSCATGRSETCSHTAHAFRSPGS